MVVVGRNIPVTLLDLEKVTSDSGSTGGIGPFLKVCAHAGAALLHPRDGPHRRQGVRDGLLPHPDRRAQPPGLPLPEKPARHRRLQVSPASPRYANTWGALILRKFL